MTRAEGSPPLKIIQAQLSCFQLHSVSTWGEQSYGCDWEMLIHSLHFCELMALLWFCCCSHRSHARCTIKRLCNISLPLNGFMYSGTKYFSCFMLYLLIYCLSRQNAECVCHTSYVRLSCRAARSRWPGFDQGVLFQQAGRHLHLNAHMYIKIKPGWSLPLVLSVCCAT